MGLSKGKKMYERRFTARARRVLALVQTEAQDLFGQKKTGPLGLEFMVLALSREHDGIPGRALREQNVYLEALRTKVKGIVQGDWPRHVPHIQRFLDVELSAWQEVVCHGLERIDAEHLALAVIRLDDVNGNGVLSRLGVDGRLWRTEMLQLARRQAGV